MADTHLDAAGRRRHGAPATSDGLTLPVSLPQLDRDLLITWAEHGIPTDGSTLDHVQTVLRRLVDEIHQWAGIVDELLGHCCDACEAGYRAQLTPTLFDLNEVSRG